jgi:hypothetical protein
LLFELARTCHSPPPVVDRMTVPDFAQLAAALDAMLAEDTEEVP